MQAKNSVVMGHSGPAHGWSYPLKETRAYPVTKKHTRLLPRGWDEAIVTVAVRLSLTSQAYSPRKVGPRPSPLILEVTVWVGISV